MEEPPPPCIAEEVVRALIERLLRTGLIEQHHIIEMTEGLSDEAGRVIMGAVLRSIAPTQSEWNAERARKQFRLVKGKKGYQDPD